MPYMIYFLGIICVLIIIFRLPPHWSILLGLILSLCFNYFESIQGKLKKWSTSLLQISVILLGASLNFQSVLIDGSTGILITFMSIISVLFLGQFLAKLFNVPTPLSTLISVGTSICGGSAISAIGPILKANTLIMATSLGIVFILNALSVFIFPKIGVFFNLSQIQFGTWAALAIHDTSSVVATCQLFGEEALKTGTTLKLTRALWIIPLSIFYSLLTKEKNKIKIPWFILGFMLMSLMFTVFQELSFLIPITHYLSKSGLSLTLFLIGLGLNKTQLKTIGLRPIVFGFSLWIFTLVGSLIFVLFQH